MTVVYIVSGIIAGFVIRSLLKSKKKDDGKQSDEIIKNIKQDHSNEINNLKKSHEAENKNIKEKIKQEISDDIKNIENNKKELNEKSKTLERKADLIENKEKEIISKEKDLESLKKGYEEKEKIVTEIRNKEKTILEKIARMSPKEARELLMKRVEEEAQEDAKRTYNRIVENAKRDGQREAVEIIARAIQRNSSDVTQELTVTTVALPDDDMKGRIIGREGRNIRALEQATGVNLIIDDTPGVLTISSYDGVRREIAKRSLELLIKDGRIQPVRIEEVVEKIRKEVDETIRKAGEEAALEARVSGLHNEVILLLGKLKYRTSYGQNVLMHAIEVSRLAGAMAEELGVDADFARRAGLLHDLGKAVDRDMDGNHVTIGAKLAKKYGESERLQNSIMAHHEDVVAETAEAILIQAADTISASRPGARKENIEYYVKRMTDIEELAKGFEGVKEAYCISAGREIRIIVEPDKVDDTEAANIAKSCAKKIEEQMEFPGEIKVTVIRSTKSTEVAK